MNAIRLVKTGTKPKASLSPSDLRGPRLWMARTAFLALVALLVILPLFPEIFPVDPRLPAEIARMERARAASGSQAELVWQALQAELAQRSPGGRLVIASNSGHMIQYEQPELVIEAIREVVRESQP